MSGQKNFESTDNFSKVKHFLVAALILLVVLFPVRTRIQVNYYCTHGEPVKTEKGYAWRVWWLEPFLASEVKETTLCSVHFKEESENFKKGKQLYRDGLYEQAIAELSKVTYLHPSYPEAVEIIRNCRKRLKSSSGNDKEFGSMEAYFYLLPERINGYRLQSKFIDQEDGREFLGGLYIPEKPGPILQINVSVFNLNAASKATNFARVQAKTRYPDASGKEFIGKIPVYIGYNEPYYGACFANSSFVFEVTASGKGESKEIKAELKKFCDGIIKIAEL